MTGQEAILPRAGNHTVAGSFRTWKQAVAAALETAKQLGPVQEILAQGHSLERAEAMLLDELRKSESLLHGILHTLDPKGTLSAVGQLRNLLARLGVKG